MTFIIAYLVFASVISIIALRMDADAYRGEDHLVIFFVLGVMFAPFIFVYLCYKGLNHVLKFLVQM